MRIRYPLLLASCLGLLLSACKEATVYSQESFAADSPYKLRVKNAVDAACESARRALLGQGYLIDAADEGKVKARKAYQGSGDRSNQIEMNVVCVTERRGSTLFATGVLSTYELKTSGSAASVGVSAVGSISLPIGRSADSLVKVGEQTITDGEFYRRFFTAVELTLGEIEEPEPGEPAPPPAIAPEPGPSPATIALPAAEPAITAPAVPQAAGEPEPEPLPVPDAPDASPVIAPEPDAPAASPVVVPEPGAVAVEPVVTTGPDAPAASPAAVVPGAVAQPASTGDAPPAPQQARPSAPVMIETSPATQQALPIPDAGPGPDPISTGAEESAPEAPTSSGLPDAMPPASPAVPSPSPAGSVPVEDDPSVLFEVQPGAR